MGDMTDLNPTPLWLVVFSVITIGACVLGLYIFVWGNDQLADQLTGAKTGTEPQILSMQCVRTHTVYKGQPSSIICVCGWGRARIWAPNHVCGMEP